MRHSDYLTLLPQCETLSCFTGYRSSGYLVVPIQEPALFDEPSSWDNPLFLA